jgi:predicted small lipoprotein YifL
MSFFSKLFVCSMILLSLHGCGQKNDLYIPAPEQVEQPQEGNEGEVSK